MSDDGGVGYVGGPLLKDIVHHIEQLEEAHIADGKYMEQLADEVQRRAVGLCVDTKCGGCEGCKRRAAEEELERERGWRTASQEALAEILKELRKVRREVRRLDV